jgi:hypothetical protein
LTEGAVFSVAMLNIIKQFGQIRTKKLRLGAQ